MGDGVGGFECGEDAFLGGEGFEGFEGFVISCGDVLNTSGIFPIGVFRTDAGVVESGGDGVDVTGLSVVVLHDVAEAAVENTFLSEGERAGMIAGLRAASSCFDTGEADGFVFNKGIEHSSGVGSATDTGDDFVGEVADFFEALLACFLTDDGLEVADDLREGVWSDDGSEDVVG